MIPLFIAFTSFLLLSSAVLVYFKYFCNPPTNEGDDEGGDPNENGLPELDLPPGISLPINDWEPDYSLVEPKKRTSGQKFS
jgi:hypothetical protein